MICHCNTTTIAARSVEVVTIHQGMRRAQGAVLEAIRPGVLASQVCEAGNRVLAQEGFESYLTYLGHGLGRNVHEQPVLATGSERVLEKGMTLMVELSTRRPEWGAIALEDDVAITADGHEDLSTIGRDLHVVNA